MALDLLADFNALHNQPANALGTLIAPMVLRDGHRVIRFSPGEERAAYFKRMLPKLYNGLGITVNIVWFMETPTGSPQLTSAFERHEAGFLFSGPSFAAGKVMVLTPGAAFAAVYSSVSHADGAEIDGLLPLEEFRLSITRSASDGAAQPIYVSGVFLTNTG